MISNTYIAKIKSKIGDLKDDEKDDALLAFAISIIELKNRSKPRNSFNYFLFGAALIMALIAIFQQWRLDDLASVNACLRHSESRECGS